LLRLWQDANHNGLSEPSELHTLVELGLNKINRRSTLNDTPAVRGMIAKVAHLVRVVE